MKARIVWGCLVAAAGAAALTFRLGTVSASGIPAALPLYYSGALEEDSTPVDGARSLELSLWRSEQSADATDRVCVASAADTKIDRGRFRIAIPSTGVGDCVTAIKNQADLWVQLEVKDGPRPTILPRTKIGSVPFAVEAARASEASGSLANTLATLERRVAALEGDSSGKLAGAWIAAPMAAASIKDSDQWVDVPGAVVSLTVSKNVTFSAMFSMSVEPNPGALDSQYVAVRIVVDGTPIPSSGAHFQPFTDHHPNVNLMGQHLGELGADRHTVKLQWRTAGKGTTWTTNPAGWGDGSIAGRTLVVTAFYK